MQPHMGVVTAGCFGLGLAPNMPALLQSDKLLNRACNHKKDQMPDMYKYVGSVMQ